MKKKNTKILMAKEVAKINDKLAKDILNEFFNKYSKEENYFYLSGLLIGGELKDLKDDSHATIYLIGADELCFYYEKALQLLRPGIKIKAINADEATVKGHYKIYSSFKV